MSEDGILTAELEYAPGFPVVYARSLRRDRRQHLRTALSVLKFENREYSVSEVVLEPAGSGKGGSNKRYIPGFFAPIWGSPALIFLTALFCLRRGGRQFLPVCLRRQTVRSRLCSWQMRWRCGRAERRMGWTQCLRRSAHSDGRFQCCYRGWMRPASLFLPLICAARGFTLSFSVSTLLQALGIDGVWRSLAASGMAAVITVPCLLLTAAACFSAAQSAPRGQLGRVFLALGRYRSAVPRLHACCRVGGSDAAPLWDGWWSDGFCKTKKTSGGAGGFFYPCCSC